MNPVVIDTNCLLQIISRHSPYRPIWNAFLQGRYDLCVSNEILEEYQEIVHGDTTHQVIYIGTNPGINKQDDDE